MHIEDSLNEDRKAGGEVGERSGGGRLNQSLRNPDSEREGREIATSWEVACKPWQTQWMCWWSRQTARFVQPTFNRQPASLTPGYSRLWIKLGPVCTSTPFPCCQWLTWLWRSAPIFSCFSSLANVNKLLYTCSWNFRFSSICWAEEVFDRHVWKHPGWKTVKKSVLFVCECTQWPFENWKIIQKGATAEPRLCVHKRVFKLTIIVGKR